MKDLAGEARLLKSDIVNFKADMIKWMFIFWIGQITATVGFIILYLKK